MILRLNILHVVDPSIYSIPDQWNGTIVEHIAGKRSDPDQRFRLGVGVDFVESDVIKILDESSGTIVYSDEHVA